MTSRRDISLSADQLLLAQHTPLVGRIARSLAQGLPPNVQKDDLVQDGLLGLIDAILRTTRDMTGAEFEHYVAQRARGAMLDGLRALDPASRDLRRTMRKVENTLQKLAHQLGHLPKESEVASALNMPLPEYQKLLLQAQGYVLVSLEDLLESANDSGFLERASRNDNEPLAILERASVRVALEAGLRLLSTQMQELLQLYYVEERKMHQIGVTLGLSESRVSQLHASAIAYLRGHLMGERVPKVLRPRKVVR
jgi:RNA polymerase sigma factor FliA